MKSFLSFGIIILSALITCCFACPDGDLTGDCFVDIDDLAIIAQQWLDQTDLEDFAAVARTWQQRGDFPVAINEIHYNSDLSYELVEFVELYNYGSKDIDLSQWYFSDGITYTFPEGTTIKAGSYVIVTEDHTQRTVPPITSAAEKYSIAASYIPGHFQGKLKNSGETIELRTKTGEKVDEVDYQLGFPWPTVGDAISGEGTGHSIQLINALADNDLAGSWRSSYPTPAAANSSVYADNTAPHIRQVKHTPNEPTSADTVTITAKVTDPDGVAHVSAVLKAIEPGNYIPKGDSSYYSNLTSYAMNDDGIGGDEYANDSIYTVQVPSSYQGNRNLIRYRISMMDDLGSSLTVPYLDDPQRFFAYFIYDGVPAWTGANRPGVTDAVTYDKTVMNSLAVYHLISRNSDVEDCTWYSKYSGSEYLWYGTLVYDGKVYDDIRYRARGGVWRYAMGKNMWKFDFNRGHYFQGRDDYGKKYAEKRNKLNFSACIQQGSFGHRGEQGMFEAAGFKIFNLMGVEAPNTNWLQFRIIDQANENGSSQYDSDFWGLYLAIEQMDERFLDEHSLLDGNLYKIEGYNATSKNQSSTQQIDGTDYDAFKSHWYRTGTKPSESWWRQNVDLERYYSYRCVVEGIHHGDIAYGKNYYFYHNPLTSIWTMYPWDLDLTWADNMYGDGKEPFVNSTHGAIFSTNAQLLIEYNNRLREFHDLFYNSDQMHSLLDELASIIDDPDGGLSIVDADRAMWDYNPVMISSVVIPSKSGQGRFYQAASTHDFPGMVQKMKDYVTGNRQFDTYSEDPQIPQRPVISYIGEPDHPENDLRFQTTAFSDSTGSFAAMKWRIAEVEPLASPSNPIENILLVAQESVWNYFKGTQEPSTVQGQWRQVGFDDSAWQEGQTPVGYGVMNDGSVFNTTLSDMRGKYRTVYLRKEFTVNDPAIFETLQLNVLYDDGFNLWINGNRVAWELVSGENLAYNATSVSASAPERYVSFSVSNPSDVLVAGTNVIAVQVLNASLSGSSDCAMDVELKGLVAQGVEASATSKLTKPGKYEIEAIWENESTAYDSDVRIPADGVKPGNTYRVRCKMKDDTGRWSHWSDPIQFVAGEAIAADILNYLRVTELMYNNGDADFIEFKNISSTKTLDLSDVLITVGVEFVFSGSDVESLAPGEFVLVVKDQGDFEGQYGTNLNDKIAGEFASGSLSNSGEIVKIEDTWNGTIIEFEYNDARGWPIAADGAGHSIVPLELSMEEQPLGTLDYGANWRASSYIGGSPGTEDPAPPTKTVIINEFMAHTDYFVAPHESNDWIELYNAGGIAVELNNHWYLSDDNDDLKKYALPASSLPGGSFISYDQVTHFNTDGTGLAGWGLDKAGEILLLSYLPGTAENRVVDCIKFKGQANDMSLSRYPDGGTYWFSTYPDTRDGSNANAVEHIVIGEIMYHPQADTDTKTYDEYIELYNPTDFDINMWTVAGPWELDGGVDYTFPTSTTLDSHDRIIIVDFDPADSARLAAFEMTYQTGTLIGGIDIFGPWSGDLSNNGERLTLEKPQDSDDLADPAAISWIIVDECIYNDYWPWPTAPDGTGTALRRKSSEATVSGNDPENWMSYAP